MNKDHIELNWISLILRIAMASLFFVAAYGKFAMGLQGTHGYILATFQDTFLPAWLLGVYAYVIPFVEAVITAWLLTGYQLRKAWIFTAFILLSLAFGMAVAQQFNTASDNYIYVLMACMGIYLSRYDYCVLGRKK